MLLDEYQSAAIGTAIYPGQGTALGLSYVALKLNGEAGEFAEHLGKAIRDDALGQDMEVQIHSELDTTAIRPVPLTDGRRDLLKKELGDVLWYVAAGAAELGVTLNDIATENLTKLASRKARGVLGGAGDNR